VGCSGSVYVGNSSLYGETGTCANPALYGSFFYRSLGVFLGFFILPKLAGMAFVVYGGMAFEVTRRKDIILPKNDQGEMNIYGKSQRDKKSF
jgi:hypothetical protein